MKFMGYDKSSSWLIAFVVAVVAVASLVHVWVHLQVIAIGYDISRETKARHDLSELNQRLSLEVRTRMDLSVVERAAREQLKMVPPDPRAIRVLVVPAAIAANERSR